MLRHPWYKVSVKVTDPSGVLIVIYDKGDKDEKKVLYSPWCHMSIKGAGPDQHGRKQGTVMQVNR